MDSTLQGFAITLAVLTALFAAGFAAYNAGLLDPIIEKIGTMVFKAKAEAQAKQMQAMGEDFADGQLDGDKQAQEVLEGAGSVDGLKKQL